MPAAPGTLNTYKYRDVPYAVWFDLSRIGWCVDTREVGRVYPAAQGKVVCDLPNAAQAVLVGKQIIEDIWRASRMLPALPPERFHGQRQLLPAAPRKPIQLPPAPVPASAPIALPPIPERALRGRKYFAMYPKKLEALHRALQNLSASSFTARDLSQQLGMQPSTHDAQTGRIIRWLEAQGYVARAGRRGSFALTDAGHRWVGSPLVIATPPSVERPRAKRSAERWRQALLELASKGSFTPQDFAAQLGMTDIHGAAILKRLEHDEYVKLVATRGQPGGSFRRYFELTDKGRAWVEGTKNPRGGMHPLALAAIIAGVGLLTAGIASKFLTPTSNVTSPATASQLGGAALQDAQSDIGVVETSPNSGVRVDQMLSNVGVNVPANWCAAAVSTWIFEASTMLGVTRPIKGSASVVTLMNQFKDASNPRVSFLPADYLRAHPEAIAPGMVLILSRGGTGSGLGHTGIVEQNLGGGRIATIEGNSGPNSDRVTRNQHDLNSMPSFIGMGVLNDVPGYSITGVGYYNDPPDSPIFATVGVGGPPLETVSLVFPANRLQIEAEVARTTAERVEGLSHRATLASNHGMLFVFDANGDHGFWMRETYVPLDILFLDERFIVVGALENMQPGDLIVRRIGVPSRYALEMPAGFIRTHGIHTGQRVVEVATPLS